MRKISEYCNVYNNSTNAWFAFWNMDVYVNPGRIVIYMILIQIISKYY